MFKQKFVRTLCMFKQNILFVLEAIAKKTTYMSSSFIKLSQNSFMEVLIAACLSRCIAYYMHAYMGIPLLRKIYLGKSAVGF